MDHFAKKEDEIAVAFREKRLQRNFQGYSLKLAEDMIGLGVTSVGYVAGTYVQNAKDLESYYAWLADNKLPVQKGFVLTEDDFLRRYLIQELMCNFEIDKKAFKELWKKDFDEHFSITMEGLVENTAAHLRATPLGALFIRNIAMKMDAYQRDGHYSKAV
jgi:oxygen-independent coproporphyrinogen-3 oxidase